MERTLINQSVELVGQTVLLRGWVASKRDHGKLTFVDLRDRSGIMQCVGFGGLMSDFSVESVVELEGTVQARPEKLINPNMATGSIEISVNKATMINAATHHPLVVADDGRDEKEESRLRYRYLDLRRERMQKTMKMRNQLSQELRQELLSQDFLEIETPILTKSTKEGARDFVVPSRFQPGKFYALPQSPQQYKQLLMVAGLERYFQFARCFRDEDLRADRGFEFTQLDLEMSFVNREDVMNTVENVVKNAVQASGGKLRDQQFPVVTYQEAMTKYGADRFDLRSDEEKADGTLAFAWVIDFPFFKKVDQNDAAEVADGKSGWTFTHNPFSTPIPEHLEWHMAGENLDQIITAQYDLVCNGLEVGGGSIRAHDPAVLRQTFKIMGYSEAETDASIGHMLEAFTTGAPPHGGIALGLDRLVTLLAGETSLKEAIPFPTTATGRTAVMEAPAELGDEQLKMLNLAIKQSK